MKNHAEVCKVELIHADVVESVRSAMTEERYLYTLADFFKVLGDSTRMRIMSALDIHEMCVCDLAALLGMTTSAISHQLHSLRQANLVKFRREGKVVYYALSDAHVRDIFEMGLAHIREDE